MSKLYTLIGLPASGKSTFCKSHNECVIVSTDNIRYELYGNAEIQDNPKRVFNIAHSRIEKALSNGKDVIFDATNLTPLSRKNIFNHTNCKHIAIYFDINVNTCIERNLKRDRIVPIEVIKKMSKRITKPLKSEPFDEVIVIH